MTGTSNDRRVSAPVNDQPRIHTTFLIASTSLSGSADHDEMTFANTVVNTLPDKVAALAWVQPWEELAAQGWIPTAIDTTPFLAAFQVFWVPGPPGPVWDTAEDALTGIARYWNTRLDETSGAIKLDGEPIPFAVFPLDIPTTELMVQASAFSVHTDPVPIPGLRL